MAYPRPNIQELGIIRPDAPYGAISVTSTPRKACANGTAKIEGVTSVIITPTNGVVYWGSDSSVSASTGTPIQQSVTAILTIKPDGDIWLVSAGTVDVRIVES